ncbi:UNVERIFIED_CONTAM: hypothetical protein K2H54_046642 [Gekko kuhli]
MIEYNLPVSLRHTSLKWIQAIVSHLYRGTRYWSGEERQLGFKVQGSPLLGEFKIFTQDTVLPGSCSFSRHRSLERAGSQAENTMIALSFSETQMTGIYPHTQGIPVITVITGNLVQGLAGAIL